MSARAASARRRQVGAAFRSAGGLREGAEIVSIGGQPIRIGPWRGSDRIAELAPLGESGIGRADEVREVLGRLAARRFDEVVTAAVPEPNTRPFLDAGFAPRERLHLLAHPLGDVPRAGWRATRRARPADRAGVLDVDRRAFEPFWQLDAAGLEDAVTATPVSRFRITTGVRGRITGYAVFGLAGRRGYLQRLAVDPDVRRQGIATRLVNDGLSWLIRHGATSALVNTQERNATALRLYLRLGFVPEPYHLVVLWAPLTGGVGPDLTP